MYVDIHVTISENVIYVYMGVSIGEFLTGGYVVVKLPKELIEESDKLIGKMGFRTRPEVIKHAIRKFLFDISNSSSTLEITGVPASG